MADIKNHSTLTTGLVSYWDLEEASGTRYDLHGSNDLADYNTVTSATGKIGNCAEFTAANSEALNAGDFATFSAFSVSIWVNPDRVDTTETIFHKADDSTNSEFRLLMLSTGNFQWSIGNGTVYGTNKQVAHGMSAGTWYHIVLTFDGSSSAKLYKNGSVLDSDTTSQTIPNGNQDFVIGIRKRNAVYSIPFDGQLDDVGFWTKELTTTEITALYNSGDGLPYYAPADVKNDSGLSTSLVSYWEMEEATGATRTDSHGSNDLTDNNTVGQATGIQGNGADFEASNSEYLSITDAAQSGLDLSTAASFSFWVKTESDTDAVVIGKFSPAGYYLQINVGTNNTIRFSDGSNTKDSDALTWSIGTWYHVVVTYNAGSYAFYVNGVAKGSGTGMLSSLNNSAASFYLGTWSALVNKLDAVLDEVGVWSRALSSSDVAALYNSGAGIPYDAGGATGYANTVMGVASANIGKVMGVATANISKVMGV